MVGDSVDGRGRPSRGPFASSSAPTAPRSNLLREHLRERALLLVLDNFEHVAAAAPIVADLLREAPWP